MMIFILGEPTTSVPPGETTTTTTTREVPRGPTPPLLENAQTRITLSWPNEPNDLDLYVRGYEYAHGFLLSSCLVYYSEKCGCPSVCQDLDNDSGGKQIVNPQLPRTFYGIAKVKCAFKGTYHVRKHSILLRSSPLLKHALKILI